jgi:7-cyano-7-deazaguanine synthase in queuosine biosynthesis
MSDLLLYSGGLDSTLLLYTLRPSHCLWIGYGQPDTELEYAARHAADRRAIP